MMSKTYGMWISVFLVWAFGLYIDLMHKKNDFLRYQELKQHYIASQHQAQKQSVLPKLQWPQLLKVWIAVAKIKHCEIMLIQPLPQFGFRIKIQGTFVDLLQWLYVVHQKLPQLIMTKIIIEHQSLGYLQMQIQGYRNVSL